MLRRKLRPLGCLFRSPATRIRLSPRSGLRLVEGEPTEGVRMDPGRRPRQLARSAQCPKTRSRPHQAVMSEKPSEPRGVQKTRMKCTKRKYENSVRQAEVRLGLSRDLGP